MVQTTLCDDQMKEICPCDDTAWQANVCSADGQARNAVVWVATPVSDVASMPCRTCRASSSISAKVTSSRDARRLVPKRSARRAPSPAEPVRPTLASTHRPLARSCKQPALAVRKTNVCQRNVLCRTGVLSAGLIARGNTSLTSVVRHCRSYTLGNSPRDSAYLPSLPARC